MSYGASIYSFDRKLPISVENLRSAFCERLGTIANPAPFVLESEPQLAMDRLLRECLTRKPPKD